MSPDISERSFEEAIDCGLLQHGPDACAGDTTAVRETPPPYGETPPGGYRRRSPEDYDRTRCLLPRDVVDFVLATQPREWENAIVGIERDQLESDDKFMRHLAQVVRNGLGDRAGTCIDPKTQIVQGRTVCLVSCQRSPEPVFLKWKGVEAAPEGDFFVRSGPGTVKLPPESAREYIRTRFGRDIGERGA